MKILRIGTHVYTVTVLKIELFVFLSHLQLAELRYSYYFSGVNIGSVNTLFSAVGVNILLSVEVHLEDADGKKNSVDPDKTAPCGAFGSGFSLFAETYLF